jgi:Htaa
MTARIRSRAGLAVSLVALVALAVPLSAGAKPTAGTGNANLKLRIKVKRGGWNESRALKLFTFGGARQIRVERATRTIFPVKSIDFGKRKPVVYLRGGVKLQLPDRKGQSARLGHLRVVLEKRSATIVGKFPHGRRFPVLRSARPAKYNATSGAVRLRGSGLQLTSKGRRTIHRRVGVHLEHGAAGTGSLGGRATPKLGPPVTLVGGHGDWGVSNDWRQFILGSQGGGPSGEIVVSGGVQKFDDYLPNGFYTFPFASGTFKAGMYGAADRYAMRTTGAVTFSKEGQSWVFANPIVRFQGATGELVVEVAGAAVVPFATLDMGAVTPTLSTDGNTISWQGVPVTLTADGAAAWGRYKAGDTLDPLTLSVTFG